jgi:hypothetical protein
MSQPLIISIPHSLGREEATRRLKSGLARMQGQFGGLAFSDQTWTTDQQLQFRAAAFGQTASGNIVVDDDQVKIEVHLPWFLAPLANKTKALMQQHGRLLLEK